MFILPQRDREDVLPDSLLQVMPGVPPAVLQALEPLPQGAVCGRCTAYRDGYCGERFNVRVREGDLGCDLFVGRDGNLST